MRDHRDGLGLQPRQTHWHPFHATEYMGTLEQLQIVRRISGKYKVHQTLPATKTEYN